MSITRKPTLLTCSIVKRNKHARYVAAEAKADCRCWGTLFQWAVLRLAECTMLNDKIPTVIRRMGWVGLVGRLRPELKAA